MAFMKRLITNVRGARSLSSRSSTNPVPETPRPPLPIADDDFVQRPTGNMYGFTIKACERLLLEAESDRPPDPKAVLRARLRLATAFYFELKFKEADKMFEDVIDSSISLFGGGDYETARAILYCCRNLNELQKWDRAERCLQRASQYITPETHERTRDTFELAKALVESAQGRTLLRSNVDPVAGKKLLRAAQEQLELFCSRVEQRRFHLDEDLLSATGELAIVHSALEEPHKALKIDYQLLAKRQEKAMGRMDGHVCQSYMNTAGRFAKLGSYREAENLLRELLRRLKAEELYDANARGQIIVSTHALCQLLEHCDRACEARDTALEYVPELKEKRLLAMTVPPSFEPWNAHWLPRPS